MTVAISPQPAFSDTMRQALLMAGDRSYSAVKDSGAYLFSEEPEEDADQRQEFWDIAVYLLSNKRKSDAVMKLLQKRNKQLNEYQRLGFDTLSEIKVLAYSYIEAMKTFDLPEGEETIRHIPYFEKEGHLYLTCISGNDQYSYAHLQDGKVVFADEETDPSGMRTVPPHLPVHQDRGTVSYIVGIPRREMLESAPLLSPDELYSRIRVHFSRYIDAQDRDFELFVYYVLYSWYYPKCNTTPYLRFLGDTGKGKSRFLKVISDLCIYPIRASGASSPSGIMRFKEKWMGTLIIDEADLRGDQSDSLIKYLNLGFEKDNHYLLTDSSDLSKTQIFDPFGPKLIAMRQPFQDSATEGRCFSFTPNETSREDIPPELPSRYHEEVAALRAMIARFTLEHWGEVSEECMISCSGLRIEGRLKQMARPLSAILSLFPDGEERFIEYLTVRQQEIRRTRSESTEGMMFNYILALAFGEEDLLSDDRYGQYYQGGEIQAITTRMIADWFKVRSRAVNLALYGIGMDQRQKRIDLKHGRKNVRTFFVPDRKKWSEMMQRYYFDEEGGEIPECPACLKGPLYDSEQAGLSVGVSSSDLWVSAGGQSVLSESGPELTNGVVPVGGSIAPEYETLRDFFVYHGMDQGLSVGEYEPIPEGRRADLYCRCRGCRDPDRSNPRFWIPGRPYNQVCQRHYDEMKSLNAKENEV